MKNKILKKDEKVLRVLSVKGEAMLVIDCIKRTMPRWVDSAATDGYQECTEIELLILTSMELPDTETMDAGGIKYMHKHYTMIAGLLPFIGDEKQRSNLIDAISKELKVGKQTIRKTLCMYLVYQNIAALAPKQKDDEHELTADEKNMRWALNKFFYNKNKNSLPTAYTMMLKEKYCDASGILLPEHPTIHQFKYFYRKHKNMQTFYISRDGLKNYQRNNRPLLGDGIQEFASNVGIGMLDATICDIYLVDDAGNVVGRPILVACIDAYSSLCMGYSLLWEGGVYSLRNLMLNVIADKVAWCKKFGILISETNWNSDKLPGTLVTDITNVIQCKCYSSVIGNKAVQEAYAGKSFYKDLMTFGKGNAYEAGKVVALPYKYNNIFSRSTSALPYCIKVNRNKSSITFTVPKSATKGKNYTVDTYAEALEIGRKCKAEYIRKEVDRERRAGYIPDFILEKMEEWADRCEQGLIEIWETAADAELEQAILKGVL